LASTWIWKSVAGREESDAAMTTGGSTPKSYRVLVIFGGDSPERAVSLLSGLTVSNALREAGHIVGTWDPSETPWTELIPADWDIAFPMLHGTNGEDGVLQKTLQQIGLPWIGCSAASSALTFDKSLTRERLLQCGIQVPSGQTITSPEAPAPQQYPLVVKPARQGSSIGITIVNCEADWQPALAMAFSLGSDVVVESYIDGREVSVPVVDGTVLPAIEIRVPGGWYNYHSKYESDATEYCVAPPDLPGNLNEVAAKACEVCATSGILRVDFRVDNDGRAYVLEINTIPGMSPHSLVPMSVEWTGISLVEFCDRRIHHRMNLLSSD
jgi:D-alanine-D-alanine ligase